MSCPCKKKPCNCNDVPKITPEGYHSSSTTGGIIPSSYYPANGVIYPTSAEVPYQRILEVPIETGSNAVDAYQALVLLHTNPDCIEDMPDCQSPTGVIAASVTTTSIAIVWNLNETALNYLIKATQNGVQVYESIVGPTVSSLLISNLVADREYRITVASLCDSELNPNTCNSVTIIVNTLGLS